MEKKPENIEAYNRAVQHFGTPLDVGIALGYCGKRADKATIQKVRSRIAMWRRYGVPKLAQKKLDKIYKKANQSESA
jgi:hypothetical protein